MQGTKLQQTIEGRGRRTRLNGGSTRLSRAVRVLLFAAAATGNAVDDEPACESSGESVGQGAIGEERTQKDYYTKVSHYDDIWGADNLHFGYFPQLEQQSLVRLDQKQAAKAMTQHMIEFAGIGPGASVLDLGSGKGLACVDVATFTDASCLGVDLTPSNVERANALAAVHSWVSVSFVEGSFTSLPEAVLAQAPFDFVWAQVSLCHAHPFLDQIFEQVKLVLAPGGRFVVNDFLGGEAAPSAATRDHVYKRLHLESLRGPRAWRAAADGAGLSLLKYEQLDRHLAHAYGEMERLARQAGITSADGTLLADNYKESVAATRRGDIGMNLALYELRLE